MFRTLADQPSLERTTTERQMAVLLRIGAGLDILGDVSITVDYPSDLVAWTNVLTRPAVVAWRATDSGTRFVQVSDHSTRPPVHGIITAVLPADHRRQFWNTLLRQGEPTPGNERKLDRNDLITAWTSEPGNSASQGGESSEAR